MHIQKTTRTRSTKLPDPEPDSDDLEINPGKGTKSRTAKATKTPARAAARSTTVTRSRATSSVAETDEPSGSDVVEVAKPKVKGPKRKAKQQATTVEEDESEEIANPLRKSTRAKKTRSVFEDIEADVNFEESGSRQTQLRRSTRSRSKAPAENSDSDVSVKSVRSTRSTKSARGTATKVKGKAKTRPVVKESEEEDMSTPVQALRKSTRATAPLKTAKTKGRKPSAEDSVGTESSEMPPPPKRPKSTAKSRKKIIESESEDWQSAQEDVAQTPRPSTTKKARGRPPKATKPPKPPQEPSPVPPSPPPTSNASRASGSYMSESELHAPAREDSSGAKKPTANATVQPLHTKFGNRNHVSTESRAQPLDSSRLPPIGSKENGGDKNTIIIDASDDEDDTRQFVASKSTVYNSTSSNSSKSKVNGTSINVTEKSKSIVAKKRESFIGVVLSSSPRVTHQSSKTRGKVTEKHVVDMDVDEVVVLDQPSRSAETDRDSPVIVDKGKGKATAAPTKSKPSTSIPERKQKAVVQSEASDSGMDVDDRDDHVVRDTGSTRDSRQPSTPRRDPPRKLFGDISNPFTAAPQQNSNDAANPLSAFEAPYGRVPAEVIYALTEEEKEMTVEEWTKREMEIQLELFREHGLRKIREFKERAAEARRQIEGL